MKCVLHIGTAKTATTLLQEWLYSNRDGLAQKGIYLPETIGKPNNRSLAGAFQTRFDIWTKRRNIETIEQLQKYSELIRENFSEEIRNVSDEYDICLISSEQLHSALTDDKPVARLSDFLKTIFDHVTVICYFRPQFDLAISLYSMKLKAREDLSLSQTLANITPEIRRYNHLAAANLWSSVFGVENCKFRLYDRDVFYGRDIRKDLLKCIAPDLDDDGLDMTAKQANVSLKGLEAAAYLAINRSLPWGKEFGVENFKLNKQAKKRLSQIPSLMQGGLLLENGDHISESFESTNKVLLEKYFSGAGVFVPKQDPKVKALVFTRHEVKSIIGDIIAALSPLLHSTARLDAVAAAEVRDVTVAIASDAVASSAKLDDEAPVFTQQEVEALIGDIIATLSPLFRNSKTSDTTAAEILREVTGVIKVDSALSLRNALSLVLLAQMLSPNDDIITETRAALEMQLKMDAAN